MLESIGDVHFTSFEGIRKINSLEPLKNIELKAMYEDYFEGTGIDADKIHKPRIPDKFASMQIRMTYFDANGEKNYTLVTFQNNEILNIRMSE